jgi:hypothetical protein
MTKINSAAVRQPSSAPAKTILLVDRMIHGGIDIPVT